MTLLLFWLVAVYPESSVPFALWTGLVCLLIDAAVANWLVNGRPSR